MNKNTDRRSFFKKSVLATIGSLVFPFRSFSGSYSPKGNTASFVIENQKLKFDIDWVEMMKNHDLIWEKVPSDMTEAPHFGNGLIGSMIWIEDNCLRLQIFRSDVHDHADETFGWTAYSRPRYQIGYFTLKTRGEITSCNLRQDIYNAELTGIINTKLGSLKINHFVHRRDDVIYTKIESSGNEELSEWQWHPFEAKGSRRGKPEDKQYGQHYAPYKELKNPEHQLSVKKGISVGLQDLSAGGNYATAWKDTRTTKIKTVLLIAVENSYPEKSSVGKAISRITKVNGEIKRNEKHWKDAHNRWWHNYYPESFVTFPDAVGQTFYWNNVYRLACCTRSDAQYIDTPGMWNSGGPWPYSTHDFNTQIAHFPVYTSNQLHLKETLLHSLRRNQNNLIDNVVPEEWQDDSALLFLATAYDLKGKRDGDGRYSEMVGCLPWLLNNCWLQYRFTMDKKILKEVIFPLLRRSINLYRHLLYRGADDKFHLPPTFSPETGNVADCNFDLALIKWGCSKLIEICSILKIDDPLINEWETIGKQLTEYSVDERGYMLGKDKPAPVDHQHMSHLLMIYPLYLENIDNNNDFELLAKSVRNFRPATALPKMAASQSSPAAAALGLGELALELMNSIIYSHSDDEKLGKNGMYYLATPCIETSLSYNTCVQDMLLQSWGNKIRVFPALPDVWQDVAFHDFRAEGAFLVSAGRKNGKTQFVRLKSLAGEPCIIHPSIEGIIETNNHNKNKLVELGKGFWKIDLQKGEEIFLFQRNKEPDFIIEPLIIEPGKINYFGSKKDF